MQVFHPRSIATQYPCSIASPITHVDPLVQSTVSKSSLDLPIKQLRVHALWIGKCVPWTTSIAV